MGQRKQFVTPGVATHIVKSTFGLESKLFNSVLKRCVRTAAVVSGLLTVASAQAIVYVGSWDPTFNLTDVNFGLAGGSRIELGWRGHFLGDVSAFCSPGAGTGLVVVGTGAGCAASLSSAVVDLYAETDPGKATIASINFDLSPAGSLNVLALLYDDGILRQLRTTASGLNLATDVPPGSIYGTIDTSALRWQLVFDFIDPIVAEAGIFATGAGGGGAGGAGVADYNGPQLSYRWPGCSGLGANNQDCAGANSPDFAPRLIVGLAAVPEPDSLALAALALTALWGLGRGRGSQRLTATTA